MLYRSNIFKFLIITCLNGRVYENSILLCFNTSSLNELWTKDVINPQNIYIFEIDVFYKYINKQFTAFYSLNF